MRIENLQIGKRLGLGFGALLVMMLAIVALSFLRLDAAKLALGDMLGYQKRADIANGWLSKTQLNMTRAVAVAKAGPNQPEVAAHFEPLMAQTTAEISELQKALEASLTDATAKALFDEVAQRRSAYISARQAVFAALKSPDPANADSLLESGMMPAARAYLDSMGKLLALHEARSKAEVEAMQAGLSQAAVVLVALFVGALFVGAGLAWVITRSVTGPVRAAVQVAEAIAANDLSREIDSHRRDELGDLLRALSRMQTSLRQVVTQVRSASSQISIASAEIATGNQDLSARTEQTASNLQQTASSMEQLTGTVMQSADSARQANQLASSAAEVAARGGQVVSQVVTTMDEINASAKRIADIIGVIDGIAFQTNILALNAAVEAARAGEQGRGFAVVAGEVRSLAGRSAEAAKEIKSLIGASVDRVDAGSKLVVDAGRTMQEIVGSVQRVSDIIGEISAAAAEQSDGIGQVNGAVTQLDQMTQQNAALVEQSAAAAGSLKDQASRLVGVINGFRLDPRAEPAPGPSAPSVPAPPHLPAAVGTALPATVKAPKAAPRPTAPAAPARAPMAAAPAAPAKMDSPAAPASGGTDKGDWETF